MKKYTFRILFVFVLSLRAFGQFSGATPDEIRRFDGSMASLVANGNSTSPGTPTYTTNYSNEIALAIFSWNGATNWSSAPTTGTNILSTTPTTGQYNAYVNYQTVSSPGSVASVTGTYSGTVQWTAETLTLVPNGTFILRTPTSAQQGDGTGTTITVTKPGGEATGDFVLVCAIWNTATNSLIQPSTFAPILIETSTSGSQLACYAKVAGSEPASYTFTQTGTSRITAFAMAFAGVLYPDELLTSASSSFSAADISKDLCVASKRQNQTAANIPQACGTIGAVLSATTLVGWGVWNTSTSTANFEVRYGTDNTTALQNAINNNPNGGTVSLPSGGMMILGTGQSATSITFPSAVPVNLKGQGSGMANWGQQPHTNNANAMGSELVVANTSLSGSAVAISPSTGPGGDSNVLSYHLSDFTLWGGAGTNADGGGAGAGLNGIKTTNVDRFLMENVAIGNFAGNNIEIYGTVYSDQNTLINVFSTFAGDDALYVHNISNNQNTVLINSQFENSVRYGIHLGNTSGGIIWSFVMMGANTVDRNGGVGTGTQMFVDPGSTVTGCDIGNTYWEEDSALANVPVIGNVYLLAGCNFSKSQTLIKPSGSFASSVFWNTLVPVTGNLSGFGTSPSVVSGNVISAGLVTFRVNIGTGGTATSGTVGGLAASLNGWNCNVQDTTNSTNTRETSFSTTSVTVTGVSAWAAGDVLLFNCTSF